MPLPHALEMICRSLLYFVQRGRRRFWHERMIGNVDGGFYLELDVRRKTPPSIQRYAVLKRSSSYSTHLRTPHKWSSIRSVGTRHISTKVYKQPRLKHHLLSHPSRTLHEIPQAHTPPQSPARAHAQPRRGHRPSHRPHRRRTGRERTRRGTGPPRPGGGPSPQGRAGRRDCRGGLPMAGARAPGESGNTTASSVPPW